MVLVKPPFISKGCLYRVRPNQKKQQLIDNCFFIARDISKVCPLKNLHGLAPKLIQNRDDQSIWHAHASFLIQSWDHRTSNVTCTCLHAVWNGFMARCSPSLPITSAPDYYSVDTSGHQFMLLTLVNTRGDYPKKRHYAVNTAVFVLALTRHTRALYTFRDLI